MKKEKKVAGSEPDNASTQDGSALDQRTEFVVGMAALAAVLVQSGTPLEGYIVEHHPKLGNSRVEAFIGWNSRADAQRAYDALVEAYNQPDGEVEFIALADMNAGKIVHAIMAPFGEVDHDFLMNFKSANALN